MVGGVEACGLGELRAEVGDLHDPTGCGRDRAAQVVDAENREQARIERSGCEHHLIGPGDRAHCVDRRRDISGHQLDPADVAAVLHGDLPLDFSASDFRLQHDGFGGGRQDPPDGPQQPAGRVERGGEVAGGVGEADEDQIAERVTIELTGRETVFERVRPELVVGEGHETPTEVSRREHAQIAAETSRRAPVVGHADDRGDRRRVPADTAERSRQPVPASERDDRRPRVSHDRGPGDGRLPENPAARAFRRAPRR